MSKLTGKARARARARKGAAAAGSAGHGLMTSPGCRGVMVWHADGSCECPEARMGRCPGMALPHRDEVACRRVPAETRGAVLVHVCKGCQTALEDDARVPQQAAHH